MEINLWQVIFQAANFGVILYLLAKYLYKPLMKLLDERAKKINEGLAAAEKNVKNAAEAEKAVKAELTKAKKAGAVIIADAEKEAKAKAAEIVEAARVKAKAEANKIVSDAKVSVEAFDKRVKAEASKIAASMLKDALIGLPAKDAEKITSNIIAQLS